MNQKVHQNCDDCINHPASNRDRPCDSEVTCRTMLRYYKVIPQEGLTGLLRRHHRTNTIAVVPSHRHQPQYRHHTPNMVNIRQVDCYADNLYLAKNNLSVTLIM